MEDFDSSLLPKSGYLPTQWDRQVDEFDSPGISAGGASLPFQIVDASTGGGTPAARSAGNVIRPPPPAIASTKLPTKAAAQSNKSIIIKVP